MALQITTSNNDGDLEGILELQKKNLQSNLSAEETADQGFVTVMHSLDDLRKLNAVEKHIICRDGVKVIGYLLSMTAASKDAIPILIPMFRIFDEVIYRNKAVSAYTYIVVGQVCVDKPYRGKGILDRAYQAYKNSFHNKYDFAITEIATRNIRSIRAHIRIGFSVVHNYLAPDGEEWAIVIWDW